MHKKFLNIKNALLNNWFNKAFLFNTIIVSCAFFIKINVYAQTSNLQNNYLSFSTNTQSISNLTSKDSTTFNNINFRFSRISLAYKHGIYQYTKYTNNNLKFFDLNISPSLQISNATFGKENLNRTLVNFRLGLNGLFIASNKNSILINANIFANEDEYTFQDALYRYSSILIFNRKVSDKFSYRLGATFTYLFGEPFFLPILGFKVKTSQKSTLNVTLPLGINWRKQSKIDRIQYGFSLRPNGGINRYQNKLSVDTSNTILILRRRAFQFTTDLRIVNKTNLLLFQLGFNTNPRVVFTNQGSNMPVNNFSFNGSNNLYANITFLWFINKKNKKEKRNNDYNSITEDDVIDNSWLDF